MDISSLAEPLAASSIIKPTTGDPPGRDLTGRLHFRDSVRIAAAYTPVK